MKAIRQFIITHAAMTYCRVWMLFHKYSNQLGIGIKPVITKTPSLAPVQEKTPNPNSARQGDKKVSAFAQMRK